MSDMLQLVVRSNWFTVVFRAAHDKAKAYRTRQFQLGRLFHGSKNGGAR